MRLSAHPCINLSCRTVIFNVSSDRWCSSSSNGRRKVWCFTKALRCIPYGQLSAMNEAWMEIDPDFEFSLAADVWHFILYLKILFLFLNLGAPWCSPKPNLHEPEPLCAGSGSMTGCTEPQCSGAGSLKTAWTWTEPDHSQSKWVCSTLIN